MSQALYRKYRPSTFKDVTSQEHVIKTIQNQIISGKVAHAYLFMGPRGIGKTTIARLVAKALNCEKRKSYEPCNACDACKEITGGASLDVYEIDAASHTDVENVRENIIKSVRFAPNRLNYKIYIIDEVHMLSASSFNALLKTLEEPPAHAIFILATTEIHKIPQTIISRCQRFDFRRVRPVDLVERMKMIVKAEGIKVEEDVLKEIARHADGGVRDAESLLGQVLALGEDKIDMEIASLVLPATTNLLVLDFVDAVLARDASKAIHLLNTYVEQGIDLRHFVDDTIEMMRTLLLASVGGRDQIADSYDTDTADRLGTMITTGEGLFGKAIEELLEARRFMKTDKIPQLPVELAILKISAGGAVQPVAPVEPPKVDPPKPPTQPKKEPKKEEKKEEEVIEENDGEMEEEEQETVGGIHESPVRTNKKTEEVQEVEEANGVGQSPSGLSSEPEGDSIEKVITLKDVQRRWEEIFEEVKKVNASLRLLLESGEVVDVVENTVHLGFAYDFYSETVNQEKNRRLIEGVLEKIFNCKLKVRGIYKKQEVDDAAAALVEEFGGSVV
jgi:DNA polymerase-3 subunit gamma/tau